jgi:DNA-binding transcriptional ArsR family regulator
MLHEETGWTCLHVMTVSMSLNSDQVARAMKALSEPNRLEILRLVNERQGENGVACTEVLSHLRISQSTFSHHVCELRDAELLTGTPAGRTVLLSVNRPLFEALSLQMKQYS